METSFFAILTLPLVYGPEITTCRYKGLLQEYVMLCYRFPHKVAPLAVLRFPAQSGPFCTMWFRQFTKNVTKTGHPDGSHPHSTEHNMLPVAYLISKQAVPYRTRGGTCCLVGSTPKIRSLADSSMTSHITWQNPNRLYHSNLAQTTASILTRSIHISMDGRPSLTKTQAKPNITKDGKTCTTLMTAWLSITTQHNPDPKVWGLGIVLKHSSQRVC
jgi:hypothetical protein